MPAAESFTLVLIRTCVATAGWAFSFGVATQAVSHWLDGRGASDTVIGLAHAAYYLGLACASVVTPALMRRVGPTLPAWAMLASAGSIALFPAADGVASWLALRFVSGCFGALALIPLETHVSRASSADVRARNFAFYAVALTLGGAAGIGCGLHLVGIEPLHAFWLAGATPVVCGAVLGRGFATPSTAGPAWADVAASLPQRLLSYGTAWYQGFLEGGMLAFLSLYLLSRGFSADAAGLLMGATLVGVIVFQVPVAWLADRLGRVPVLFGCYAVVAACLLGVPGLEGQAALAGCLFLFGACSGAMYPLGLAMLGDGDRDGGLARAYAWYLAVECVGSQLGAAAMGRARDVFGGGSMFVVGLGAMGLALLPWAVARSQSAGARPASADSGRLDRAA